MTYTPKVYGTTSKVLYPLGQLYAVPPGVRADEIHTKAEEGLTYTEAGYLLSYEWWGNEVDPDEALEWMYEHG